MSDTNSTLCPTDNTQTIDQTSFWDSDGVDWDAHRIGWLIAGCCAAVTLLITMINVCFHASNYTNRGEQRQIIRILYMPMVYGIISFFSYRFFRSYTYYEFIESAYESVTLSAFLLLLIEFVAATATEHSVDNAILRKEKSSLPLPFCCWRYRPTKAYFMYTTKWSVLQYVILSPLLSIAAIVCQYYGVLCESGPYSFKTAHAYISFIDFVSITIALYGLLIFYGLTSEELKGRKPLSKFLSIKLIVMFTFYQGFIFDWLEGKVIKGTQYWTETNVADGLNALATCIEMVLFSAFMFYAYSWHEYKVPGAPRLGFGKALWDSINYSDFAHEITGSLKFFIDYARGKPGTHGPRIPVMDASGKRQKMDFGQAFGLTPRPEPYLTDGRRRSELYNRGGMRSMTSSSSASASGNAGMGESLSMSAVRGPRHLQSYDEHTRLAPYSYENGTNSSGSVTMASAPSAPVGHHAQGGQGLGQGEAHDAYADPYARRMSGESDYETGVAQ